MSILKVTAAGTVNKRENPSRIALGLLVVLLLVAQAFLAAGCRVAAETASDAERQSTSVAEEGSTYVFAVCGDNHTVGIENGVFEEIIESAKSKGAAFIINVGDVSNVGARGEFKLYAGIIDSAGLPVYTIPGNHDIDVSEEGAADFEELVGPLHNSFDYGGDHFLILNNGDEDVGLSQEELEWAWSDLAANTGERHLFIFSHVPMGSAAISRLSGESDSSFSSGMRFVDRALNNDNVSAFFSGHFHGYLSYRIGQVPAYVSGGAGAPPYSNIIAGFYNYLLVAVDDERVDIDVIRIEDR